MKYRRWMILGAVVAVLAAFGGFEWLMWRTPSEAKTAQDTAENKVETPEHAAWAAAHPDEAQPADTPHAQVSGRVLETNGTPIGDASVCAWFERTGPTRADELAPNCSTTGADGKYVLAEVHVAVSFKVSATAAGHVPASYASKTGEHELRLAVSEQKDGIDLALASGGVAVHGRVKDALGGMVPGAAVAVAMADDSGTAATTTDDKGEFVAYVAAGLVRVQASAPGYTEAFASGYAPEHHFELSLLPGSVIVGRAIERPAGTPVANAEIAAIATDQRGRKSARTAEDGTFRIEGLSPGNYRLEGIAPGLSGYARLAVIVGVAETSHDTVVELDRSPPVTAHVLESDTHLPCTSGEVTMRDKRVNEYAVGTIEPDGAVRFVAVLPGTYSVDVSCDDHIAQPKYADLTIATKPLEGIVWEVTRGSLARGFVVDATGKAVANATVRAESEEGSSRPFTHTDTSGAFTLKGLSAGKYVVSATAERAGAESHVDVEVDGHRDARDLRIELGRGAKLIGSVTDADGKPVSGIAINLSGPTYTRVETRDDGSFLATGLVPGAYRATAAADAMRLRFIGPGGEDIGEMAPVQVLAGEDVKKALVVERRTGSLEGRVVDGRGEALPDFFVEALRTGGRSRRSYGANPGRVITDSSGHFKLERLGDGDYTVRAYRQSGAVGMVEHASVGATDLRIAVVAGNLSGTVTGPNGERPDRFTVQVVNKSKGVTRNESVFHTAGAFSISELPPGTYDVSADAAEGVGHGTVTVTDGAPGVLDISLEAKPPQGENE